MIKCRYAGAGVQPQYNPTAYFSFIYNRKRSREGKTKYRGETVEYLLQFTQQINSKLVWKVKLHASTML